MQAFTFIHAADLHLDAALPGPGRKALPEESGKDSFTSLLSGAVHEALARLVDLCISEQAEFLLLSGDVFNQADATLSAHYALRGACEKLSETGIKVFWARGNHDPATSGRLPLKYPDSVFIFGTDAESVTVQKDGAEIARITGISHANLREKHNLASRLSGLGKGESFQIGLLHCAVSGKSGKHEAYAPCSLEDLQNMDYWALGHVHTRALLRNDPPVAYSGSLQGLHINEDGPHGCYAVSVDSTGLAQVNFKEIAPLRWEKLSVDINTVQELEDDGSLPDRLEEEILRHVALLAQTIASSPATGSNEKTWPVRGLLLRLELKGRGALDTFLRQKNNLDDFHLRLNETLASETSDIKTRIKDITLNTAPDVDIESVMQADNLLGETLRKAAAFAEQAEKNTDEKTEEEQALANTIMDDLKELYGDSRFRRYLTPPDEAELAELSRQAASLCLNLFEVE